MYLYRKPCDTKTLSEEELEMNTQKHKKTDSTESQFYTALIMRGTEKQYKNLLKYIHSHNGAKVFYKCKRLVSVNVTPDNSVTFATSEPDLIVSTAELRHVAH